MTPLGHAEAHERLADLALEPGGIERLGDPTSDPLAAHVAGCDACAREVAAWRRTSARLATAAGGVGDDRLDLATLAGDDPIAPPAALRGRVLEAVRGLPASAPDRASVTPVAATVTPGAGPARRGPSFAARILPLAAVFAAVLIAGGLVLERQAQLDAATRESARLAAAAVTMERILSEPHVVVDLVNAAGEVTGSISWSRHDLAVVTTGLTPPPAGREYRCWIERDGERSPVGKMFFAGATAYWTGSLDEWAEISFDGGIFGVSLEPIDGAEGNPPVLTGDLES